MCDIRLIMVFVLMVGGAVKILHPPEMDLAPIYRWGFNAMQRDNLGQGLCYVNLIYFTSHLKKNHFFVIYYCISNDIVFVNFE